MSDFPHGQWRDDQPSKTPEQIAAENALFDSQVCPCEDVEPEPMSEYDVPDDWITYTGEINRSIFEYAARNAESEAASIIRLCEEEDFNKIEQDQARQNALYSDSSSDEQSPPPGERNERQALMVPEKAAPRLQTTPAPIAPPFPEAALNPPSFLEAAPSVSPFLAAAPSAPPFLKPAPIAPPFPEAALSPPSFLEAAPSVSPLLAAAPSASPFLEAALSPHRFLEAAPSASPFLEATPSAPPYLEAALATPVFGEATTSTANQAVVPRQEASVQILNEWSVYIANEKAREAAAKSNEASNKARVARTIAEAAELTGHQDAVHLAEDSVRYDIYAARAAQMVIETELHAKQVALAFQRAKEIAAAERRVSVNAPLNDEIINEWSVLVAAENAWDAAANSEQATRTALIARTIAEAAELTGHKNAVRHAADSVQYDIYAAQKAQVAIDAQVHAKQIAQAFERARKAGEESKVVLKAPPTNWVQKKE